MPTISTITCGNDIHIGLYEDGDTIAAASHRTVEKMAEQLPPLDKYSRVLDIGAGYGGAARHIAREFGCRITALNLSEAENQRHRKMNREAGLDKLIDVVDLRTAKIGPLTMWSGPRTPFCTAATGPRS